MFFYQKEQNSFFKSNLKIFCIHIFIALFLLSQTTTPNPLVFHAPTQLAFNTQYTDTDLLLQKSSCPGRTVRTAPSIAFLATGAPTQTHPCTRPWDPLSTRALLPRPPLNPCQACPRTLWQTGLFRENRTPLRSGPSPGACMKVGVSIYIFGGSWIRAAWGCWLGEGPLCV